MLEVRVIIMSRLTEKVKDIDDYIKLPTKNKQEFINKLGQLEDIEERLGCPLEEIFEFVKLLKKYYYVDITGQLQARNVWNNANLNENELYKINHIFNDIKSKDE